jgi:tryptophan synthase beta chain
MRNIIAFAFALTFFAGHEGIIFALESAHGGAAAMALARELPSSKSIIVNMSGRGDKDLFIAAPHFNRKDWKHFLRNEADRL